jgi:hypothetical protein
MLAALRLAIVAALLGIASSAMPRALGAEPSLKDVVRRMGAYVETYGEKASIIVATERFAQRVRRAAGLDQERDTVADFAIVKASGFGGWVGFRDVVEVDGARVSDREERLIQILTSASGRMDEAQRLSNESARFNIGPIQRNFNVPTAGLFFFRPENLDRFKFTRKGGPRDGIWEIGFRETSRPTLVRTPAGVSVPAEGSIWVDAGTGTVTRTRLHMKIAAGQTRDDPRTASAEIDVAYRRVAALDMWLPEAMTELYEGNANGPWRLFAEAKYTDYRQFQTSVRIK